MKRRRSEFLASVGSMLLLADILHSVLQQRGSVRSRGKDKCDDYSRQVDKALKRFCTAVDYTAQKADNLLKKKIAPSTTAHKSTILFTLLPVDETKVK